MLFHHFYVYMSFIERIWAYKSLDVVGGMRRSHSCFIVRELDE